MKTFFKKRYPWLILIAIVLIVIWPLITPGFLPTHDGEYHLIRFWQFKKMLSYGNLFPRWAPDLNFGYGEPLFNFQYPLPNYLGALFSGLGLSLADSFKFTLALGYLTSAVFAYLWLKKHFKNNVALFGAVSGILVPYFFVDIFVRGSVGEVWAIAFALGILAAVSYRNKTALSLLSAALILSHNILALIFTGLIFIYLLIQDKKLIKYLILGIGISAYFWLPALLERQYVVGLNPVSFKDYFVQFYQLIIPGWGTGLAGSGISGNEMSTQIGIFPLFIFILIIIKLVTHKLKTQAETIFWLTASLLGIILTLRIMLPVWNIFPFLAYLQFPWRLLSILIPAICYLSAAAVSKFKHNYWIYVIIILNLVAVFSYVRPAIYVPRSDNYYLTKPEFTDGTNSIGNAFTTIWDRGIKARAPTELIVLFGIASYQMVTNQPLHKVYNIASKNAVIRIPILYYPGWTASLNGKLIQINYQNTGLIDLNIGSGDSKIEVNFQEPKERIIADLVSILCLSLLLGLGILKKTKYADRF